jgi:3'-phosphoadenosine 5'-phosphosulfate sulfotransferase (PAPS reductase)/FAD synthetase
MTEFSNENSGMIQEVYDALDEGALFVANHSGGKDSQAMFIWLAKIIPREHLLVVHATLGRHEWPWALEHAQFQAADANVEFRVASSYKSLFDMVDHRYQTRPEVPSWPSASTRQCTSDLKRDPIKKVIRHYVKEKGYTRVINCLGLRAEESPGRAKKQCFKCDSNMSKAGRTVHDWLPIHNFTNAQVRQTVADAGQYLHYAYELGNERLSCQFCIMGSVNDLQNGAKHNPELYADYCDMERKTGYTMHMSRKSLPELTGIQPVAWR